MTGFSKVGTMGAVVDGFQNEAHGLLNHLISHTRNAEPPHLAVGLRYEGGPYRLEAELLDSHLFYDGLNGFHREAVECFPVGSWRHISRLCFDALIGYDVQVSPVQQPIEIIINPLSVPVGFAKVF